MQEKNYLNDQNAFIECSNTMVDVNKNMMRTTQVAIEMIADIMTNKKIGDIIKELFIRCIKVNISLVFVIQSYFSAPKDMRLNSTHYLIMRINSGKESQNIKINHSADIDFNDFMRIYRECTREPYFFLTIDTTLSAGNPLRFRNTLIKMTATDKIKIVDNKIKLNQLQYEAAKVKDSREAAKVFALSSKNLLEKYKYLTGEDLRHT